MTWCIGASPAPYRDVHMRISPGFGLGLVGAGLSLLPWALDQLSVTLPRGVAVGLAVLGGAMILAGALLEGLAHQRHRRKPSSPTTFAYLRGVQGFKSEGNLSSADRFIDAQGSSDVTTCHDVHAPHGDLEQQ